MDPRRRLPTRAASSRWTMLIGSLLAGILAFAATGRPADLEKPVTHRLAADADPSAADTRSPAPMWKRPLLRMSRWARLPGPFQRRAAAAEPATGTASRYVVPAARRVLPDPSASPVIVRSDSGHIRSPAASVVAGLSSSDPAPAPPARGESEPAADQPPVEETAAAPAASTARASLSSSSADSSEVGGEAERGPATQPATAWVARDAGLTASRAAPPQPADPKPVVAKRATEVPVSIAAEVPASKVQSPAQPAAKKPATAAKPAYPRTRTTAASVPPSPAAPVVGVAAYYQSLQQNAPRRSSTNVDPQPAPQGTWLATYQRLLQQKQADNTADESPETPHR